MNDTDTDSTGLPPGSPCPLCNEPGARLLAQGEDFEYRTLPGPFRMRQCCACGHGFLDPPPARENLAAIYPSTYYTINPRSPIHFEGGIQKIKMRRDVDRIIKLAGAPAPRTIVDLGCGDAERLAQIGERLRGRDPGVRLIGVDLQPDPERVREIAARGVELVQGNMEERLDVIEDAGADLVIMCQIIEHLYDPFSSLETIASKLAPGGRLLIETPNLGGPDFRRFKDKHWGGYHFPRHFHLFTTRTLRQAVERAGLEVVEGGFIPSGFSIVSFRNRLGLTSIERGDRFGEFLHMRNLLVVGASTAFDLAVIALGGETSNQYLIARRPTPS